MPHLSSAISVSPGSSERQWLAQNGLFNYRNSLSPSNDQDPHCSIPERTILARATRWGSYRAAWLWVS
ncbi:MAG: hypothetical protein MI750_04650 [Xanthomonadales bacterium]|nr:hypothetical protein [Xanthomonadales bacterium]